MTSGSDPNVGLLQTDVDSRERIPGSPLVPGGVAWSEDGRLAVVSDSSVLIATFRSRQLEMFQPQGPAVSKDFVFLPERTAGERLPIEIPSFSHPLDSGLPRGSASYFLLNESDRHQHNPKEMSLSKNAGAAFVGAVWGPRGSAPNSSCALLALTASSRISLHFPPSFHMSWKETAVFSDKLFDFFQSKNFRLSPAHDNHLSQSVKVTVTSVDEKGPKKKRKGLSSDEEQVARNSIAEYAHKCAMMSTLSVAWSPFMLTSDKQDTISLIAFSGRKVSTVWVYPYPSFVSDIPGQQQSLLSQVPVAWIDTEQYGWVSTSTWQQMHRHGTAYLVQESLGLALGTSEGNVLLASIPVRATARDGTPHVVVIDRVIAAPHSQPVFDLCLGNTWTFSNSPTNDLIVASGSTISVWNLKKKQSKPTATWKAHDGNLTGIDINFFGDTVFSAAVDGTINVWEKSTGKKLFSSDTSSAVSSPDSTMPTLAASTVGKYPIFGLAMSPSSAQLASVFIIPPASRPNRKSQADVSYSRVSSSLEYIPLPWVKDSQQFVDVVCRILEESQSVSSFTDVVWFCYNDNAAVLSLQGSSELALPSLLNKINGTSDGQNDSNLLSRQPVYLNLCEELEKRYYDSPSAGNPPEPGKKNPVPLFLQASLLLRSAITPADHQVAVQDAALTKIRRTLGVYWAERCLKALQVASKKAKKSIRGSLGSSSPERNSALVMADFLSVQDPLTPRRKTLVTEIYSQLDTAENIAEWTKYAEANAREDLGNRASTEDTTAAIARVPPSREMCFICDKPVPFGELEIACEAGHTLERCFLSFRCIAAMEVWKCLGCGASACEIDLSTGTSPFYLLDAEAFEETDATSAAAGMKIICRLCGNYCSFSKY